MVFCCIRSFRCCISVVKAPHRCFFKRSMFSRLICYRIFIPTPLRYVYYTSAYCGLYRWCPACEAPAILMVFCCIRPFRCCISIMKTQDRRFFKCSMRSWLIRYRVFILAPLRYVGCISAHGIFYHWCPACKAPPRLMVFCRIRPFRCCISVMEFRGRCFFKRSMLSWLIRYRIFILAPLRYIGCTSAHGIFYHWCPACKAPPILMVFCCIRSFRRCISIMKTQGRRFFKCSMLSWLIRYRIFILAPLRYIGCTSAHGIFYHWCPACKAPPILMVFCCIRSFRRCISIMKTQGRRFFKCSMLSWLIRYRIFILAPLRYIGCTSAHGIFYHWCPACKAPPILMVFCCIRSFRRYISVMKAWGGRFFKRSMFSWLIYYRVFILAPLCYIGCISAYCAFRHWIPACKAPACFMLIHSIRRLRGCISIVQISYCCCFKCSVSSWKIDNCIGFLLPLRYIGDCFAYSRFYFWTPANKFPACFVIIPCIWFLWCCVPIMKTWDSYFFKRSMLSWLIRHAVLITAPLCCIHCISVYRFLN